MALAFTSLRGAICLVSSATTRHSIQRSFSSSALPNKKKPSSTSLLWQVATFAVVGTTFVIVGNYLSSPSWRYEEDAADDEPKPPQAEITSRVYFDISIDDTPTGRIVMGLHGNIVPKTVHNFETICRGGERIGNIDMTYKGSVFHRIIPEFMCQSGEKPGRSIYSSLHIDGRFKDENFQLKHIGPGILAMANSGKDTNGSQFYITTKRTAHLDGGHVVFGIVIEGWHVVKEIEACGSRSGKPFRKVVIMDCGVLGEEEENKQNSS